MNLVFNELKLRLTDGNVENAEVEIYDWRGVFVLEKNNQQANGDFITLNLQELKAGIYFLKIKDKNLFFTKK